MSDFYFGDMLLDTLTIYTNRMALGSNMGYELGSETVKHAAWTCTIQSATASQSPGDEKKGEFGNLGVVSPFMAIGSEVLTDLAIGDYARDQDGNEYEITRWDNPGGNNPVGDVFLIGLKQRT
jgi:hypothetical protein